MHIQMEPCAGLSKRNDCVLHTVASTNKPERISTNNMLLSVQAVVVLTKISSYGVKGELFTIGYVSSDSRANHELQKPAISIVIESFQASG